MSSNAASRKTSSPSKRATSDNYNNDDKDDKYAKVKGTKDRLFRRVFTFIAIAFMITAYVCHVTSSDIENKGKLRHRLSRITEKIKLNDSLMKKLNDKVKNKYHGSLHHGSLSGGVSNDKAVAAVNAGIEVLSENSAIEKLEKRRLELDTQVRDIKATGIIMETDKKSLEVTRDLQDVTRFMIKAKYGNHPHYRVKVDLEFQSSIPDFDTNGPDGTVVIEMAPIEYIPVSVYNWLEIARTWKSGAFHRNANHVLQATTHARAVTESLAFQEYSPKHPHKKGTVGYCGRPSGPCWYISILDNSGNHGPGSQQKKNPHEADANFGRIVEGFDDVVPRIHSTPQMSWLDKENQIKIKTMTILVPGPDGAFTEWKP